MSPEHFLHRLRELTRLDADALWSAFVAQTGTADPDHFLASLRERELISTAVFADLASVGTIEVTPEPQSPRSRTLLGMAPANPATLSSPLAAADPLAGDGTMLAADSTLPGRGAVALAAHATLAAPRNEPPTDPPVAAAGGPAPGSGETTNYRMLGVLGRGAMGEVLVAKDIDLRRKVAFKRILAGMARAPGLAARFFEEVQVTAQLDHPHIIPIYGLEIDAQGRIGYAMKLVKGHTLTDLLAQAAQGAADRTPAAVCERIAAHLDCFLKVCDAMAYAHSKGVLHRDLKPDNIMVGSYNEVYVMDWGISRVIGAHKADSDALPTPVTSDNPGVRTQVGAVLGTPAYMSPEQALGKNTELDARSDLYTLGLILQEIVTLQRAVGGNTLVGLLGRAAQGERDPIVHKNPRVRIAPELCAIIAKATARKPDDRYPSVAALAQDVRRYLRGEEVLAKPDPPLQAVVRWIGRHRGITLIALLGVLLVAAGAVIGLLERNQRALRRAAHHEQALAQLLGKVAARSHAVDNHFFRYEGALQRLAGRAVESLDEPPHQANAPIYFSEDFDHRQVPQAALRTAPHYQTAITLDHPALHLGPGVERAAVAHDVQALAELGPAFRDLLLASHGEIPEHIDALAAERMIGTHGVPMLRAFITLASGVHSVYPGLGGFPPDYDGRRRPKYLLGLGQHGVRWGNPYRDRYGQGLLLPCALALYDNDRRFVGVAGFDMTFDFIIERLLGMPDRAALEVDLVDAQGRIVIRAQRTPPRGADARLGDARDASTSADNMPVLAELPHPSVVEAIRMHQSGHQELAATRRVITYSPLAALGWYYVVIADLDILLGK